MSYRIEIETNDGRVRSMRAANQKMVVEQLVNYIALMLGDHVIIEKNGREWL